MAAMALAAVQGGASGIRANGPDDVSAICEKVDVPVIGINKVVTDSSVSITPSFSAAQEVAMAGAKIIGVDSICRARTGEPLSELLGLIKSELNCGVFADVSTLEEGLAAQAMGADFVATTLSGYTDETRAKCTGPDLELVESLVKHGEAPVFAEGRYETPDQVHAALDLGAAGVVVGTAISNPREITRRFVLGSQRNSQ
jgi:putative N-acetylmannosamine-6-phosphate epimerase